LEIVKGTTEDILASNNRLAKARKDKRIVEKFFPYILIPEPDVRKTLKKELGYKFKVLGVTAEKGEVYKVKVLTNGVEKEFRIKKNGILIGN
jgi:hypothetical protein